MHIEEKHSQRIASKLLKRGEEISSLHQNESCNRVEFIQKCYRDRDQNQSQHAQGVPMVDRFEQVIQSQGDKDKHGFADEVRRNAETKQCLGGGDVAGSLHGISGHYQFAGNVEEAEDAHN
jgi:hypothetical protein